MAVLVANPEYGLADNPYTGNSPAVYLFASVWPQGQPGKSGAALSDDPTFPVVDSISAAGVTWYQILADSVTTAGYYTSTSVLAVDLNDNLFTPGDTICFFFAADANDPGTSRSYWSEFTGATDDLSEVSLNPMEFTCLPAGGWNRGGDILYVDNADGLGVQPYFDTSFQHLAIDGLVDRYDTRAPTSGMNNGPARE